MSDEDRRKHPLIRKKPTFFLRVRSVAGMFEVHPDSVRKGKGAFGSLTRYKLGRRVRFSREEVEALIQPDEKPRKFRPRSAETVTVPHALGGSESCEVSFEKEEVDAPVHHKPQLRGLVRRGNRFKRLTGVGGSEPRTSEVSEARRLQASLIRLYNKPASYWSQRCNCIEGYCPYCGRKMARRKNFGHYCPTKNCRYEFGVPTCWENSAAVEKARASLDPYDSDPYR